MAHGTDGRKHRADGARSRAAILDHAARLASIYGLEGLSIALVAGDVGMSKGGVYGHFGSKLALQLATVDAALDIFQREVIVPAASAPEGIARLRALCRHGLDYYRRKVFPGGCFFSAAMAEYCGRTGVVRDRVADVNTGWLGLLAAQISLARDAGDLAPDTDPTLLAFEINGLLSAANFHYALHDDAAALDRAAAAIERRLILSGGIDVAAT